MNQKTAKIIRRFVKVTNKQLMRPNEEMHYKKVKKLFLSQSTSMQKKHLDWMKDVIHKSKMVIPVREELNQIAE